MPKWHVPAFQAGACQKLKGSIESSDAEVAAAQAKTNIFSGSGKLRSTCRDVHKAKGRFYTAGGPDPDNFIVL